MKVSTEIVVSKKIAATQAAAKTSQGALATANLKGQYPGVQKVTVSVTGPHEPDGERVKTTGSASGPFFVVTATGEVA